MSGRAPVHAALSQLETSPPPRWRLTGPSVRPNLHGLIRYPAMMVPRMQGDIIDAVVGNIGRPCKVLDPFVGSGTVMTEALTRDLDFVGVDINPLAALVCEAKAAVDGGIDVEEAAAIVLSSLRSDVEDTIEVDFPNRSKWFSDESALSFSRIRRAILKVADVGARKLMWTVLAETVRLCSNSRTSTYKLHIRPPEERVDARKVIETFEAGIKQALVRVADYRATVAPRLRKPSVKILCADVRRAPLCWDTPEHQILVTSPPYGDNQTTIPYGQFSYLALQWIPRADLPCIEGFDLVNNSNSIDAASLGGRLKGAREKEETLRGLSPHFDRFVKQAEVDGKSVATRKVSGFVADFAEAVRHIRNSTPVNAHWIITTGNRTAAGLTVPFDMICKDILLGLGGKSVVALRRDLPNKRMPNRNSQGAMITTETTNVIEFS